MLLISSSWFDYFCLRRKGKKNIKDHEPDRETEKREKEEERKIEAVFG